MQFKTEMDAKRVVGSRNIYYPPLEVSWDAIQNPLPLKHVQPVRKHHGSHPAPPWFRTGHNDQPFHFSEQMRALVADIACRFQPLAHIDVSRIIFVLMKLPRLVSSWKLRSSHLKTDTIRHVPGF